MHVACCRGRASSVCWGSPDEGTGNEEMPLGYGILKRQRQGRATIGCHWRCLSSSSAATGAASSFSPATINPSHRQSTPIPFRPPAPARPRELLVAGLGGSSQRKGEGLAWPAQGPTKSLPFVVDRHSSPSPSPMQWSLQRSLQPVAPATSVSKYDRGQEMKHKLRAGHGPAAASVRRPQQSIQNVELPAAQSCRFCLRRLPPFM